MPKKVEIITTVLLVGILAAVLVQNVFMRRKSPKKAPSAVVTPAAMQGNGAPGDAAGARALPEVKMKLQKERAEKQWGRDPFQRTRTAEFGYRTSSLELKGISIGAKGEGYALINQEIVKVGDTVEGCEVISIERNRVLLQKGGQSFYLKLPEEGIDVLKATK